MLTVLCVLIVVVGEASAQPPTEWQNIIPQPRSIQVTGEQWPLVTGNQPVASLVLADTQRRTRIGAEEINDRVVSLGAPALPIVEARDVAQLGAVSGLPIVLGDCYGGALLKSIISDCEVPITRDDPGPQGYVVRFLTFGGRKLIFLCGSDPQGTLYAGVTFRWLVERTTDGVSATVCTVRDWPDFKWRGTGSLQQMRATFPAYGKTGEEFVKALKGQVDWMLRHKLNFLGDYFYGGEKVPPLETASQWMRPLNAYARERGMMGEEYQSTNVGYEARDAGNPRFAGMQLLGGNYFSWSDDELLHKRAAELAEFYDAAGLDCVVLHPQDGGGVPDPELWSKRSEADRARWGDDRAGADAHVFNIFYEEIRKRNPRATVVYVIYPYSALYLDWDGIRKYYPDVSYEQFEKTGRNYFKRIATLIPEDVHVCVWLGKRQYMDEFRSIFGNRPMYYWYKMASGWVDAGWIITAPRFMGSNYYGHPGDIMAARIDRNFPNYITRMVACQFAWNTKSEGAEEFQGDYYDFIQDNQMPNVVVDKWGLLACKNMWGSQAGPIVFQAFNKGIIPSLIVQPSRVVEAPNRFRRKQGLPPIEVTPDMMLRQAQGCRAAAEALDSVLAMKPTFDDIAERLFVYHLQRTHCLAAYAQAHYHLMLANQAVAKGDEAGVVENVAAGKAALDAGLADMEKVLAVTNTMKGYDPKYPKTAAKGVFPAVPSVDADFNKMRDSLEAARKRMADARSTVTPLKHQGTVKVAVYDPTPDGGNAIGHTSWLMTLEGIEGLEAQATDDLTLSNLLKYDVLLYPQCSTGRSAGRYEFLEVLKRYVEEGGGGVLFSHNSVGFERAQFGMETTFPSIGLGAVARLDSDKVLVAAEHPITKGYAVGAEGKHSYYDHLTIKPGSKGVVVLKDPGGGAVMVAGQQKRGRVVYDGTIMLTPANKPLKAEGFERDILLNAVRWLAQRP